MTLTSFLDADTAIIAQPITLSFRHDGRTRRSRRTFWPYVVMLLRELVEVKYQADLDANSQRLQPAFDAARAWADGNARCLDRDRA